MHHKLAEYVFYHQRKKTFVLFLDFPYDVSVLGVRGRFSVKRWNLSI